MYYTKDKILKKLNIDDNTLQYWRSINHIHYSQKTDKYDLDSVLQTRTMTIGLDYLSEEIKDEILFYAKNQSSFGRYLFSQAQKGNEISGQKADKIGQKEYGLKSYMGMSVCTFTKGSITSMETWYTKTIKNLEDKILKMKSELKNLIESNKINSFHKKFVKGKKKKLHFLENKLSQYQSKPYLSTWFGKKYKNDKDKYRKSRTQFIIMGEQDKNGNRFIRIQRNANSESGELELKIFKHKVPFKISNNHKRTFSLDHFNRQSIRVNYNKNGKLVLNITYYYIKPVELEKIYKSKGTVGIDIGPKEIAVCFVKNDGNPSFYKHYNTGNLLDKKTEETQREISLILDDIVKQAKYHHFYSITIENLKFRPDHSFKSKKLNRMLHKFPREIFKSLLESKCAFNGIKLKLINPAFTSVIGLFKYSNRDNLSTSHNSKSKDLSAALTIGRRGLGLNDKAVICIRLFGKLVSIPIKSLLSAAEHADSKLDWESYDTKSNWSLWSKLKKLGFRTTMDLTGQLSVTLQSIILELIEMKALKCNPSTLAQIKICVES